MLEIPDDDIDHKTKDYKNAAVVSNSQYGAAIGREVLQRGGSAVDAAIATMLCEGLYCPQSGGIGGGCLMTIIHDGEAFCLDGREMAPAAAFPDMFSGNKSAAAHGVLSCAIPGELMAYWEAHKKMGRLPWKSLFQPAISLCLSGIPVTTRLARAFSVNSTEIMNSPSLRELLGGQLPQLGDKLRIPLLAKTLDIIASSPKGPMELYDGDLTQTFVDDIRKQGGIFTVKDMNTYKAKWSQSVTWPLKNGDLILHTSQPPGAGYLLAYILQLTDDMLPGNSSPETYRILAEAFKYAFGLRTHMGDPAFVDMCQHIRKIKNPEHINETQRRMMRGARTIDDIAWYGAKFSNSSDSGTLNICVYAPDGDAVALTSSINTQFGSMVASTSTGILLNNHMDDFSAPRIVNSFGVPPSMTNRIAGGKRPQSSMCPSIITDPVGDVKMIIGAAGGTHILTSVAQVVIRHLWFNESLLSAIDSPRIHHQLLPMVLKYEKGLPRAIVDQLEAFGHTTKKIGPHSTVTAISKRKGKITASFDFRRGGSTDGF